MNQMIRQTAPWLIVVAFACLGCGGGSDDGGGDDPGKDPTKVTCAADADCKTGQFCSASTAGAEGLEGLTFPAHLQDACVDSVNKACFDGRCSKSGMCTLYGEECAPASEADCTNSQDCEEYNSCVFTPAVAEDALAACTLPPGDDPPPVGPVVPGNCANPQPDTPTGCGYDLEKKGKLVGDHIKNFGLKTWEQCAHYLHQDCNPDTKIIWLVLSTGW